jgi:superfamily II DNA or RNA helicase
MARIPSLSAASVATSPGVPDSRSIEQLGDPGAAEPRDRVSWTNEIRDALARRSSRASQVVEDALKAWPGDAEILLLAALTALATHQTDRAHRMLKRYSKRYVPGNMMLLLQAVAHGQQGQFARAWSLLNERGLTTDREALRWFIGDGVMDQWLLEQLREVRRQRRPTAVAKGGNAPGRPAAREAKPKAAVRGKPATRIDMQVTSASAPVSALPRLEASFEMTFDLGDADAIVVDGEDDDRNGDAAALFALRGELIRLSLFEGFDELLCPATLNGVEPHWYQIETVRKVLKQYRGRVLLADEVGLGKTIEAGMVLKEYMLRGMAERILILCPASLVGQWRDEMSARFGIDCATTHDPLSRNDPAAFWAQPRVIASIPVARRKDQAELLAGLEYDAVVVDEAHHLCGQASASYRLVDGLRKRFLLLLSATPVRNNLLELYDLLTLLQPGIFRTQKEFRAAYMVPGRPREPMNRDRLHDLMRGVMVRNTRALAALRMPRRHASTLRVNAEAEETACYEELAALVRDAAARGGEEHRLSFQHVLSAAGSSPAAAAAAVGRLADRHPEDRRWSALARRLRAIPAGAKEAALSRLLARNSDEKKLVFMHNRDSMAHLAELLGRQNIPFVRFSGDMSGPRKDEAVETFRQRVPVLLCTESGGEGRNLQFCNTLINFDIPWNPMAIEQRIGRIDRIGQARDVFIFNLVTAGTIEDAMLRILDEKINMFELVVGEVGAILGEVDEQRQFPALVLDAWLRETEQARAEAFSRIETDLITARRAYEEVKRLDEALFENELDAA